MSEVSDPSFGATVARSKLALSATTGSHAGTPATDASVLLSPSIFVPGAEAEGPIAYEVKFLLEEAQARDLVGRLAGRLALDPFADPAMDNAYLTTSLYTDTPSFDVFRRNEGYNCDKFRVRRYGVSGPLFVERKSKDGEKVRKQRAKVDTIEVGKLGEAALNGEWSGRWFHSELLTKALRPVCRITYERVAYTGVTEGGVARLTFDRNVRGAIGSDWKLEAVGAAPELLPGQVVCEFKYRTAMPALFRGLVADMNLVPTGVSKYRLFIQSAGLAPVAAEARDDA